MKKDFSPDFLKDLSKIKKQNKKLFQKIDKQLTLFEQNPKHPSLRVHKLSGVYKNRWSISINKSLRMIYMIEENKEPVAYFIVIGTHDQVYRK